MEVFVVVLTLVVAGGYAAFFIRCMEGDKPWARDFARAMLMLDVHRAHMESFREPREAANNEAQHLDDEVTETEPARLVA